MHPINCAESIYEYILIFKQNSNIPIGSGRDNMNTSKTTPEYAWAKNILVSSMQVNVSGGSGIISELTGLHINTLAKKNETVHPSANNIINALIALNV